MKFDKIILPFISVIVFIVALEIILRFSGFLFIFLQDYRNKIELGRSKEYRVLCIGESTTALGAKQSYPYILGKLLNSGSKKTFAVINKGVPGTNSAAIVEQVPEYIARYKPHIIVAMMGVNDYDYNHVIVQFRKAGAFNRFISSLKIYKLFRLIELGLSPRAGFIQDSEVFLRSPSNGLLRNKVAVKPLSAKAREYYEKANTYSRRGLHSEALLMYAKVLDMDPEFPDTYLNLGWAHLILGQFDSAELFFRKAVQLDPDNDNAYSALGFCLLNQKNFSEAENAFKKAIELNYHNDKAYVDLGQCYIYQNKYAEAESIFREAIKANPDYDRAFGALALVCLEKSEDTLAENYFQQANKRRLEFCHPETRNSFRRLRDIAKKNNCLLICVQYPVRSIEGLKGIFDSMDGVYFVDNEKSFKDAIKSEGYDAYFSDRFAGDFGHCTKKGNTLLASNVARQILRIINE